MKKKELRRELRKAATMIVEKSIEIDQLKEQIEKLVQDIWDIHTLYGDIVANKNRDITKLYEKLANRPVITQSIDISPSVYPTGDTSGGYKYGRDIWEEMKKRGV